MAVDHLSLKDFTAGLGGGSLVDKIDYSVSSCEEACSQFAWVAENHYGRTTEVKSNWCTCFATSFNSARYHSID